MSAFGLLLSSSFRATSEADSERGLIQGADSGCLLSAFGQGVCFRVPSGLRLLDDGSEKRRFDALGGFWFKADPLHRVDVPARMTERLARYNVSPG